MPPALRQKLTKPAPLTPGDTLAIIAPASPPANRQAFDLAVQRFQQEGFQCVVGKHARNRNGFLAGSDRERLADFYAAFSHKKAKAVVCVRGGYGTGRLLSAIDWRKIQAHPKIFVGCSDITALLLAIHDRTKSVVFHGPMPSGLVADGFPDFTLKSLLKTLAGGTGSICDGYAARNETVVVIKKGRASGRLLGGNMSVLCSLLGTPYFPRLDNSILFLEDIGEMPFRIDRMLTQLANAGVLSKVRGIALGLFKSCEYRNPDPADNMQKLQQVFEERLSKLRIPVVSGLPFGHTEMNATLPLGCMATLDGKRGNLVIEEAGVR